MENAQTQVAQGVNKMTEVYIMFIMLIIVFISWFIGYFANGFFLCHFDLASCWNGITIIGTWVCKYLIDSLLNSNKGEMPR